MSDALSAVLTGDLVDWSRRPVEVRTSSIARIRAAAEALDEVWPGIAVGSLTIVLANLTSWALPL